MSIAKGRDCDVVIGMGGGKVIDTAKAIGNETGASVAIVPTIASTDAPTSAVSVDYTAEGAFSRYLFVPRNPDLVLVDTCVIAEAPVRFLVAGMGSRRRWVPRLGNLGAEPEGIRREEPNLSPEMALHAVQRQLDVVQCGSVDVSPSGPPLQISSSPLKNPQVGSVERLRRRPHNSLSSFFRLNPCTSTCRNYHVERRAGSER